ncbi:MAG: BLUF domain-containing protein [Sediminicola sp.]|tara:strand:+ start:37386 stop:37823 length:438 start_codon:yes stop_codon:yes gene_type:complete
MYTLTYESKAAMDLTPDQMEELLISARSKNTRLGITGCLIFYNGAFIQVIEGNRSDVMALFEKIKEDERHTEVHLFSDDEIKERTFSDWGMAYYPLDKNKASQNELEQFKKNLFLLADLSNPKNITAVLFWKRMKFMISSPSNET